ncbi:MAG: thioether cross-link-forming SCIFF peptide maturase [Clostridia bacterium]|nr:thioether cross-link-forming SCIFF peptide maturase [Clostridia bacterium]
MIHQYQIDGTYVVLDVFSGSVHVVDELAYDLIGMYETSSKEEMVSAMLQKYGCRPDVTQQEILECIEDIEGLKQEGKLFTEDAYEKVAKSYRMEQRAVKALCLHVAHVCNLNCSYCFAGQGAYRGKCGLMSLETGKKALDFLIAHSGGHVNLDVDFFGGEPLMNWEVVKALVAYGRELEKAHHKKIRFTLTTNGMLLDDEVTEFCNREMHNVVLSLDGRREVHDRFRKDYQGKGSYDTVVPKFQHFVSKRGDKSYYIRGTYTHYNTDFLQDILHMADLGFTELSMEPVVCDPSDPCALTEQDLPVLKEQYEELAREMIRRNRQGRGFTFYHYMLSLTGGPCIYKRVAGCGSGTEYLAVTPEGDLYPCHQFVGIPDYCMGNLEQGITNIDLRNQFAACNIYTRPDCADCWAKLYCAGGCAANAYHASGSIRGTYPYGCELFRKRIECALWVKIAEQCGN